MSCMSVGNVLELSRYSSHKIQTKMSSTALPVQTGIQPPQAAPGQLVTQQYVVTINGDVTGLRPPVNISGIGVTATLQLLFAVLAILLGVVAILAGCINSIDGMPIWSGLCFFMVAGILGRVSVRKQNNCSVIAYMVMSILSALAAGSMLFNALPAIFFEQHAEAAFPFRPLIPVPLGGRMAIDAVTVLVALTELVVAIVASAFCCRGTCCAPPNPLQVQYSPALPAGSVVLPEVQGQPVMIPHQGQTILINTGTPASYEAGPLPEKNGLPPPQYSQPTTTPQAAGQLTPNVNTNDRDSVGYDVAADDCTDQQPLVL